MTRLDFFTQQFADGEFYAINDTCTHQDASLADGWLEGYSVECPLHASCFDGGVELRALHTPGHSPGSTCLYAPELGTLFSGDTLFSGGPGATGRSFSSFDTIIDSIRTRLLTLPGDTEVRTGHGDSTRIRDEAPHLEEWINRGH